MTTPTTTSPSQADPAPAASLLDRLHGPADVRRLPPTELPQLAAELRAEILTVVSRQGGHLASNLGAVELTIALLRTFDPARDAVIWDTGHQTYAWKLLTGRRDLFQQLRGTGGACGFQNRTESPHDAFGAGHAGTAISAALGFAAARDRDGGPGRVVAVVGDGALGCGTSLEGLNSISETTRDFVLVVNDNKMSIARNVGAIARNLNRLIANERYNRLKARLRHGLAKLPGIGPHLHAAIHKLESAVKSLLVPGVLFEQLGLRYIGPIDGHDLGQLLRTFEAVATLREPLVIHVLTSKGYGYPKAEDAPESYHGVGRFDPADGIGEGSSEGFSHHLGRTLEALVEKDPKILAITAGMCSGTGLKPLRERHPVNLVDVGIAEEHAVVFAAGLAAAGHRPVVAIYASFMQRAMDYVFHDVCLQNLPVIFCLDRAGVVEDGPTHHGIHDLGFWRSLPNLAVLQPADGAEFEEMLRAALARGRPAVLRYPRGSAAPLAVPKRTPLEWGRAETLRDGTDVAIWAAGRETVTALAVADRLAAHGLSVAVVNVRFLIPFDEALFRLQAAAMPVVTLENHVLSGGLADCAGRCLAAMPAHRGALHRGWPLEVLAWGAESELRQHHRLDVASLTEDILRLWEKANVEHRTSNAER